MNLTEIYGDRPKKARIEIIPLIDVIFFLLATFVLFTLSLEQIRSIEVPMPVPGRAGEDNTLYIQASDAGSFFWKEGRLGVAESITAAEIPPRLADYRDRAAAPRVVVRGDLKAKFGAAVMVLDEVRKAKISQVSVETFASPAGQ